MAKRRRKIGGLEDEEDDKVALALLAGGQRQDPNIALAMELLKLQMGQGEDVSDRAFKERQQAAAEFYQGAGRDIEERKLTSGEKEAADKAIAEDVKEGTRQRELGEERAHRTERELKEDTDKKLVQAEAEKKGKRDLFDTLVRQYPEIYKPGTPEFEEELANVDESYRERVKKTEGIKQKQKYETGAKKYGEMTPKDRAKLEKGDKAAKVSIEELGGPEIYKQILDAYKQQQQTTEAPRPNLTPQVVAPPPQVTPRPQFGNYGPMAAPQEAPGYSYATKAPEGEPLPAGNVWQHQIPQASDFATESIPDFIKRVQAQPDSFGGGVPMPTSEEIVQGVETDPRYQSAEQQLLTKLSDWWNTPSAPVNTAPSSEVSQYRYGTGTQQIPAEAPELVYGEGGPSPQPGFLDNFLQQIRDYAASRPDRVPQERYPYPIGHGLPPTAPIDPRLINPGRATGYGG